MNYKEKCAALEAELHRMREPNTWNKVSTYIPDGMCSIVDAYCEEYDVTLAVAVYRLASIGATHWLADREGES